MITRPNKAITHCFSQNSRHRLILFSSTTSSLNNLALAHMVAYTKDVVWLQAPRTQSSTSAMCSSMRTKRRRFAEKSRSNVNYRKLTTSILSTFMMSSYLQDRRHKMRQAMPCYLMSCSWLKSISGQIFSN